MTNAEKLKAMTEEQLADIISRHIDCDLCVARHGRGICRADDCEQAILEWLKKEANA